MADGEHDQQEQGGAERSDIVTLVATANNGKIAADLTRKLDKIVKGVLKYGKKGELNVKITVAPPDEQDEDNPTELRISFEPKATVPSATPKGLVFFGIEDTGELTRDDPAHDQLFSVEEPLRRGQRGGNR